ncbi:MAG: 50S ribosomal protein L18 [Clostridia bacterium]|nr:50S ribosomal protein L18 [Clostridia bacterium]
MIQKPDRNKIRKARHMRTRKNIHGTAERPRMNIYRSTNHIYAQLIDDVQGHTLVSASTVDAELREQCAAATKSEAARLVGLAAGRKALAAGIKEVVFDRGGYLYTGRVAKVAEGAREAGLDF